VFSHHAGFRVVHIFVFNEAGELVLQQLGKNRDRNPLRWGSSVAGYLNLGEQYLEAATRRLWEELGVKAPLSKFGSVAMEDQGARKFITLYTTKTSKVTLRESDHIENLRFEPISNIESWLWRSPEDFTETFRFLFRFYLSTLHLAKEPL
jgi:isopentenyldiphosphate isomerase